MPVFAFLNDPGKATGNLPQGHRQFLEFVMATMSQPRLLFLDEPCAGLSPDETHVMSELVTACTQNFGALVLLIEQNINMLLGIADHFWGIESGEIVYEKSVRQTNRADIVRLLTV